MFYPGWVFVYNEWPQSAIYQNQLDFYSHTHFWLISFGASFIAILPVIIMKQSKSMFFPKLIDLVQGEKIHKDINIEEKLKIDFVKLEKDLDSEIGDDDSIRMSHGAVNNVKVSNPGTNIAAEASNSMRDEYDSYNEDEESLAESGMHKSEHQAKSSGNLLNPHHRTLEHDKRYTRSLQKNNSNQSPKFDRFTENMVEVRTNNSNISRSSRNKNGRKTGKKKLKFGTKKNSNIHKFYPQMSSVGGDTIHEKSMEEDNEESSNYSKDIKKYEESKGEFDSPSEEDMEEEEAEESSSSPTSKNRSELHSLEASSMTDRAHKLAKKQKTLALLENNSEQNNNPSIIEIKDDLGSLES